jgi:membrane protease YdiL (CAAX protease family)
MAGAQQHLTARTDPKRPLAAALVTTAVITPLSYLLPDDYAAAGVGLCFLFAVHRVALRSADTTMVRHWGLSLGGLLEATSLEPRRMLRESLEAAMWALGIALLVFPPFAVGWLLWYEPSSPLDPAPLAPLSEEALGQLLVIALPEEAFYRGYLQKALDNAWPPKRRFLGAPLGAGILVTSALFALGHLLTQPYVGRLAVFFPALLFGWLRTRTGGIGAAVLLHASSNLFASYLAQSYGLAV